MLDEVSHSRSMNTMVWDPDYKGRIGALDRHISSPASGNDTNHIFLESLPEADPEGNIRKVVEYFRCCGRVNVPAHTRSCYAISYQCSEGSKSKGKYELRSHMIVVSC